MDRRAYEKYVEDYNRRKDEAENDGEKFDERLMTEWEFDMEWWDHNRGD